MTNAPGRGGRRAGGPPAGAWRLPAPVRPIVARFAGVACPPGVRTAGRTDRVLAEFELMLGAMPPATRRALTAAFLAFDQGARLYPRARGRRFASLDDRAADGYLRALLRRRDSLAGALRRIKGLVVLCYYELPEVKEEAGYAPGPYIAAVSRRRLESYGAEIRAAEAAGATPGAAGRARGGGSPEAGPGRPAGLTTSGDVPADLHAECDVVIVGSGAGGATMAAELTGAGLDVIVVEEGGYHATESFTAENGQAMRTLYRDGGGQVALGRPPVMFAEGRCVGGSTVINGGMAFRTPARVLDGWARQENVAAISERDMEPFFAEAESRLSVGPQDPETIGRDSELLKAGARARGWRIIPNQRNQLHCAGTNNCINGCPTGAKRSMLVTSIPRALGRGARLFADCRVDRITLAGAAGGLSAVTGVTGRFIRPGGARGPRLTVRSRIVIVACGAVQTPVLLARSGIGSASRQLGRNLALHPNVNVTAFFDEEVTGWHGVHQAFQVREFSGEGITLAAVNLAPSLLAAGLPGHGRRLGELMAGYNRAVTVGCTITDTPAGRVRTTAGPGPRVFYRLTGADAAKLARGAGLAAEAMFAAGARRVLLPFDGAPEIRDAGELRRLLARPVPGRLSDVYSVHLMGTARMSEDPRRGVTDSFGAVHGRPGLFVADASLFPTPAGINPMETVIALAIRNARRLISQRDRFSL